MGKAVPATFLILLATLGLQWIVIRELPGGSLKYFHLAAIGFAGVYLLRRRAGSDVAVVLREHAFFYWCFTVYLALQLLAHTVHRQAFVEMSEIVRQGSYAFVSVLVAALFLRVESRSFQRFLMWACPVATFVVLPLLVAPLVRQGVNPLGVLADAITSGDPTVVLRGFFRSAFRTAGIDDAAPNLRHGVIGALLLSLVLSLLVWRRWRARRVSAVVLSMSAAVCLTFILVSLSRSVIVSFAVSIGVYLAHPLFRDRLRGRDLGGVVGVLFLIIALVALPQATLFREHFAGNRDSYAERYEATVNAFDRFGQSALIGSERVDETGADVVSPHDVVLNAWLGGGILAALAAAAFFLATLKRWFRLARSYVGGRKGEWMLSTSQFGAVALGAYPLARFLTAGSGSLQLVEWVALGAFFGMLTANDRARRATKEDQWTFAAASTPK